MTELEILRRRRQLVVLSAELQRATLVRRLDHVASPAQMLFGLASSAATLPLLWKLGSGLARVVGRRRQVPATRTTRSLFHKALSALKYLAVLKAFPVPKFFNR